MRRKNIRQRNKNNFKDLDKKAMILIIVLLIIIILLIVSISYFIRTAFLNKSIEKTEESIAEHFFFFLQDTAGDKFYYNCLMNNELVLDIPSTKTLLSPELLYSYNNPNNIMTITEVDLDYLPTGLVIASSSKQR